MQVYFHVVNSVLEYWVVHDVHLHNVLSLMTAEYF